MTSRPAAVMLPLLVTVTRSTPSRSRAKVTGGGVGLPGPAPAAAGKVVARSMNGGAMVTVLGETATLFTSLLSFTALAESTRASRV